VEPSHLATRLRFNHLRLVVALQEAGSLRRAAEAMHVTQSALSKSLREIEATIGVRLYERMPGRLQVTQAGEALFRAARLMLAELEQAGADVSAISAGGSATLRIGATPFLAETLVPEALAELDRGSARFRIELTEGAVPQLITLLCEGRLDAVLATWAPSSGVAVTERLSVDVLRPESLLVIAHPASPLSLRSNVGWGELAGERWILPASTSLVRQTVDSAFICHGHRPPQPAIESMSPATNVSLVAQGLGLAALPGTAMIAAERSGIVKRLDLQPAIPLPPVTLVYHALAGSSDKIEALRRATAAAIERARTGAPGSAPDPA
jgi:DNA-binding transcriptional LysR family regulator